MRNDAVGFFWDDTPPPKPPKAEKIKREPPAPTWLNDDYLPGYETAKEFPVTIMSDMDIIHSKNNGDELILDIEVYPNYLLIMFTNYTTGAVKYFEAVNEETIDGRFVFWILNNFTTVGFNSLNYDIPLCIFAINGYTPFEIRELSRSIIEDGARPGDLLRKAKMFRPKIDHIDLIEVAPLKGSLKAYAGRMHAPKMQDLPFAPEKYLNEKQITCVRWYCVNDTGNTAFLRKCLNEQIKLRYQLSEEYQVDLRSKSDAQIAETVIAHELSARTGVRVKRPQIEIGTAYRYKAPPFLSYSSELMKWAYDIILNSSFVVDPSGSISLPEAIKKLKLTINQTTYKMGIGGLHSTEQTTAHYADEDYVLIDRDVTSYYPFIILNLGLSPEHLGMPFLQVYRSIVDRRIAAKRAGDKVVAESLKIVVNGSFGKLGSKYSILYAPDLLTQVTLTGQLSLLMLIERLELNRIQVVSANTDGIVIKCRKDMINLLDDIIKNWENDTNFETEGTEYKALYSRDVNNYIAVKNDNKTKTKGSYSNPWSDNKNTAMRLHKNPTATICIEAVEKFLTSGTPVEDTIKASKDVKKFVTVRSVKGGAVKIWDETKTEYLGKTVRWIYAKDCEGEIVYAINGNKVPRSDGAYPLMELPYSLPENINYEWYENEAREILINIGAIDNEQ